MSALLHRTRQWKVVKFMGERPTSNIEVEEVEFEVDFRLVNTLFELSALEQHFMLVEQQLERSSESERQNLEEYLKKYDLAPEDSDWHLMIDEYSQNVGFVYPMVLRRGLLVALYSMCELAITEIADSI